MHYPWGYALPVSHIISTHEGMHYLWVISSVPMRICSTRESYPQYPWVISSVPMRVCSTRESCPQYLWGYAVPLSHILSTSESYPQYPWVISSVPMSHILSTCEDMQYPWVISSVPMRIRIAAPVSYIGQLWTSFRNKVSRACHKIPEWFKSWVYWQSIWDRVWLWQCWRDWRRRQNISQLCNYFK